LNLSSAEEIGAGGALFPEVTLLTTARLGSCRDRGRRTCPENLIPALSSESLLAKLFPLIVTIIRRRLEAIAMRKVLMAIAALALSDVAIAQSYTSSEYCDPWCQLGAGGGLDCSYHTFQQCLVTTRGEGGHCYENPFLSLCRRPIAPAPVHRYRR
jgi:hypothetical protein